MTIRPWAIPNGIIVGLQHGKSLNGLATSALPSEWRCALCGYLTLNAVAFPRAIMPQCWNILGVVLFLPFFPITSTKCWPSAFVILRRVWSEPLQMPSFIDPLFTDFDRCDIQFSRGLYLF